MLIRPETSDNHEAITQVTRAAFTGKYSDHPNEHLIINGLRDRGALSLSLVADIDGRTVGHVAFSVVLIDGDDKDWYGLGPISVLPEFQKQGIGSKLIRDGLSGLREMAAKGCVLVGTPQYYQRFGFKPYPELFYDGVPSPEYFMAIPFYGVVPAGKVEFDPAFYVSE